MTSRDRSEEAARLRAALAFAGLNKTKRAELLGVSSRQVTRMESGEAEVPAEAWDAISNATHVPAWFFKTGWDVPPEPEAPSVAERVEALTEETAALRHVAGDIRALKTEVAALTHTPAPKDELAEMRQHLAALEDAITELRSLAVQRVLTSAQEDTQAAASPSADELDRLRQATEAGSR